jgi:HTH-type transcriptional regulator/antitoxin HigA
MLTATKPYLELVRKVPLRPIESDQELDRAIATIDGLLAKPSLSRDEDDYLDVLSDLVYKYETASHPVEPVPDSEMLRHLMEAKAVSRGDLHQRTGISLSTIAAVLNGKRTLSREQIAAISEFFHVSSNVFALPKATRKKRATVDVQPRGARTRNSKIKKNSSR